MNKKELWLSIANYHFDNLVPTHIWDEIAAKFGGENPFTKAFADKLSRKLKWEKSFAMKAIWEYKKFVYLGVVSDFSVTPSKIIDQVWHEHLLFSSGYRKFCKEVIQYDFDHNPELISVSSQTSAFQSQYFNTIELYKKEFGIDPPSEIWDVTKFKEKTKEIKNITKNQSDSGYFDNYVDTDSLISMFPSAEASHVEFGGGEFGGGGAGGSWAHSAVSFESSSHGDSSHSSFDSSSSHSSSDSSSSDGGGSDGGSSCSSGCGGGCGS